MWGALLHLRFRPVQENPDDLCQCDAESEAALSQSRRATGETVKKGSEGVPVQARAHEEPGLAQGLGWAGVLCTMGRGPVTCESSVPRPSIALRSRYTSFCSDSPYSNLPLASRRASGSGLHGERGEPLARRRGHSGGATHGCTVQALESRSGAGTRRGARGVGVGGSTHMYVSFVHCDRQRGTRVRAAPGSLVCLSGAQD